MSASRPVPARRSPGIAATGTQAPPSTAFACRTALAPRSTRGWKSPLRPTPPTAGPCSAPMNRRASSKPWPTSASNPSLNPWALVPALGPLGHLLLPGVRGLVGPTPLQLAGGRRTPGGRPARPRCRVSSCFAGPRRRRALEGALARARDAFDQALYRQFTRRRGRCAGGSHSPLGDKANPAELDDLVQRLDRLQANIHSRDLAARLLGSVGPLEALPLERASRERLAHVSHRLWLFLKG